MSTAIEWTDETWNPITGCSQVSPGCRNCYARRQALRLARIPGSGYASGFALRRRSDRFGQPGRWRKPRRVFVCSMGDLFHERVDFSLVARVFAIMAEQERHVFQVLTKRAERLVEFDDQILAENGIEWPSNVWAGVSVETRDYLFRVRHLLRTRAPVKFVSFEPLLDRITLSADCALVDWIIVGGETGPGARRMPEHAPLSLQAQARDFGIPFFFKSWGSAYKYPKRGRSLLGGQLVHEFPEVD